MSTVGADICGNCELDLPKEVDRALCKGCSKGYHFGECSIKPQTWKSMNKVSQESWNCQSCRKGKKRTESVTSNPNTEDQPSLTSKDAEVSSLGLSKAILEKVNTLPAMQTSLDTIEKALAFLSSKYDTLLEEIKGLREENTSLKKEVELLKRKGSERDLDVVRLESEIAEMDQYGRRCNLEVHGLACDGDPRKEDVAVVVQKVADCIKVPFDKSKIHRAHRLQQRSDGKPPTLLIQFFSREDRDTWLKAGKQMKITGTFFNENLCPFYRNLLKAAKERAKLHNYAFVWFQGGRVLVRRREGDKSVIVLKNRDDLKKLSP